MKAIQYERYGPPDVMQLVDLPDRVPATDEVLIAVRAVSVGPGDCKTRSGSLDGSHPASFPKIPGRSGAGIVVALGAQADFATIGDLVCFSTPHTESGSCAEFVTRPRDQIGRVPPPLDAVAAAAVGHPGVCAWIALVETARVEPGMRVLVQGGSGTIGAQAIQLAKHLGARVSATARRKNAAYVERLGADEVIAFDEAGDAGRARFDVVLDTVGGETHRRSYAALRAGGVLVYLRAAPIDETPARTDVKTLLARIDYRPEILEKVLALAAQGVLRPQVGLTLPLAQCAEAHRRLEARTHGLGRVVLTVP